MDKGCKIKQHYRGVFNYALEVYILYCYAYSERQAWLSFCRQLSKKHNVPLSYVTGYFDGSKDNYLIEIETEIKEV